MTRVIQVAGAPGAGKTYTLRQRLEAEAADGLELHDFYWLNFTNSGRKDVEPEIREVFAGSDGDPDRRAKTFHGLALSLVISAGEIHPDTVGEQIITPGGGTDPYAEFCQRQGMTYDPDYADPRKLLDGSTDTAHTGNLLFAINDYLTQTCKAPAQYQDAPVDIPLDGDRVVGLLDAWDRFKRTDRDLRLFEHGDYVNLAAECGLYPTVELLLIDEFQDLAPLEYRLYRQWRDDGQIARIFIAGDPNQSIYSFRGGTPHYFEETDVHDRVDLTESRRCPADIASIGNAVLASHPGTDPAGFSGRAPGGEVRWRSLRDKYDLQNAVIDATERHASASPAVMLLTRTNYQLGRLTRDLRAVGVPFEVLGTRGGVWTGDLGRMLAFLNSFEGGADTFAWPNARAVIGALPDAEARRESTPRPFAGLIGRDAIAPAFEGLPSATAIAERMQIKAWKRDILVNAITAPAYLNPSEVRVGTIHTAKGLEAPAVFVFTASSEQAIRRYSRDTDDAAEEHRIYYVAATRASEELHLVDGYFNGPTAPPVDKLRTQAVVA